MSSRPDAADQHTRRALAKADERGSPRQCYYIRDEGILYYSVLLPDDGNFAQTCGEGIRPALLTLCAEPTKYDCLPGVFVVDGQLYNGITIWVAPECDPPSIHTALYLGTNARVDLQCSQIIF